MLKLYTFVLKLSGENLLKIWMGGHGNFSSVEIESPPISSLS